MLGLGSACASAPTSPGQLQLASNADLCCDGHGTDPVAGMLLRAYHCTGSNDLWKFDAQGHIVDAIWPADDPRSNQQAGSGRDMTGDSNLCIDIVGDGPDVQMLQCDQADSWELAWSTTTDTFQVHSTTKPELCLFSFTRKSAWRALPCDETEPSFDFVATSTTWAKPTTCR